MAALAIQQVEHSGALAAWCRQCARAPAGHASALGPRLWSRHQVTELRTLECLALLVETLGSERITLNTLKNKVSCDNDLVNVAVEEGISRKVIHRESYNYLSVKRPFVVSEEAYYDAVEMSIKLLWQSEGYKEGEFYLERTARKDSKIEGQWTRPDFTLVSHKKFRWTIGFEFDVVTFEVKRPDAANVIGVFEALSHSAAATRSYVLFPMKKTDWEKKNLAQASRVRDECGRHGVGLILVKDIAGSPRAEHEIRARRREIDHEKASGFLGAVLSEDGLGQIAQWK